MIKLNDERLLRPLRGTIEVPGDKSMSHRSIMFGSLAEGTTTIANFSDGEDCLRTIAAFKQLGISIERQGSDVKVYGKGIQQLQEPTQPIYFGNSGTTARLMIGLLAGLPLFSTVYGDPSLSKRPMRRVIDPLQKMGAIIYGRNNGEYLPIAIKGTKLTGIHYKLPVKSAQVKSALLLAGLLARGHMSIVEKSPTRDHTEKMLQAFGVNINVHEQTIHMEGNQKLSATTIYIPGDISSAAFFLVAAAIVPGSNITLKNIHLNDTRTGIVDVLLEMGAKLTIENKQAKNGEQFGDVHISSHPLRGITIEGDLIPRLIDEIPIIALLATQAEGTTIIKDAEELKVKETDRLHAVVTVLKNLGADIKATNDGMVIRGKTSLHGGEVSAYHDHRMAMMAAIASLITDGDVFIDDLSSINISYPTFFKDLQELTKNDV
ncbi:MAG TPA: 3-phosphoshikimate 1-carboxyvinyltransferase [Bacillota bacterium]